LNLAVKNTASYIGEISISQKSKEKPLNNRIPLIWDNWFMQSCIYHGILSAKNHWLLFVLQHATHL